MINGVTTTAYSDANQCFADRYQNGDLDFDGLSYQASAWPNGSRNHPTAFQYVGPFTNGKTYPQIQFETDIGGSSALCDVATGVGCTVPRSARTSTRTGRSARCPLRTRVEGLRLRVELRRSAAQHLGELRQGREYGTPDLSWYGGTSISAVQRNPEVSGRCATRL